MITENDRCVLSQWLRSNRGAGYVRVVSNMLLRKTLLMNTLTYSGSFYLPE